MLLVIDIGNTNIVVGVYDGDVLKDHFRISSRPNLTSDEAGFFITGFLERLRLTNEQIDRVAMCSVVPSLTDVFETMAKKHLGCLPAVISARARLPIRIEIDQPDQVGADRIANAAAGYTKYGGPIIIVDFGTATNFDVVDETGAYIGGVLIPGPETSLSELARKAARLFEVRIEPPDSVIGKSTAGALKSGLFYGTVGQVDYIIDKIIEECSGKTFKVIATGGLARGIEKYSRHIKQVEPTLTLEGLRLISEMN
ncbi:MAG: type III pantothenate kinase [candidate division Zixibacteria bacterium]|nr:type III pantothenate kinase [candidate division Zixibacteria bacterium]